MHAAASANACAFVHAFVSLCRAMGTRSQLQTVDCLCVRAAGVIFVHTFIPIYMQVMVVPGPWVSRESRRKRLPPVTFSTKHLEASPGDMLRDPGKVFAQAEATAQRLAPEDIDWVSDARRAIARLHYQVVEGTVWAIATARKEKDGEYGAVIDVVRNEVRFQGLLHRSEVSDAFINKVSAVLSVGDKIKVRDRIELVRWHRQHAAVRCVHVAC